MYVCMYIYFMKEIIFLSVNETTLQPRSQFPTLFTLYSQ